MARTDFPQEWQEWVAHNIQRGCSTADIFNTLVREGFAPEVAERALSIRRVALKRFPSDRIELHTGEGFLLPQECEELVEIIKDRLRPSTISHDGSADSSFRTSRTCDLVGGERAVRALDEKICGAMGLDPATAEPSQGQYYETSTMWKRAERLRSSTSGSSSRPGKAPRCYGTTCARMAAATTTRCITACR